MLILMAPYSSHLMCIYSCSWSLFADLLFLDFTFAALHWTMIGKTSHGARKAQNLNNHVVQRGI